MNVSPDQVAQYLRDHPEFFAHQGDLLTQLTVPSAHGGQVVSLGERQLQVLREKTQALESQMREMIRYAENNDAISEKVFTLAAKLNAVRNLDAVLQTTYHDLRERFTVPHVALRVWGMTLHPDLPECEAISSALEAQVIAMAGPRCGAEASAEVRAWFPGVGAQLRSFAWLPLLPVAEGDLRGVLVLASEDAQRFYPEMGTYYLGQLARQVGASIARYL
ncbi:MAG: DUF484 family protein [Betaproteobacteria bacterium]|nr:MAG: DUF484 family protein [Betaproteobacteria bacterium]